MKSIPAYEFQMHYYNLVSLSLEKFITTHIDTLYIPLIYPYVLK
jgi:hypothetical protein